MCPVLPAAGAGVPKVKDYFYAMGKKDPKEVPTGAWYAYHAWRNSRDQQTRAFEVVEIPWGSKAEQDAVDFVAALREAGVTEIAVTESGSALMEGDSRSGQSRCGTDRDGDR